MFLEPSPRAGMDREYQRQPLAALQQQFSDVLRSLAGIDVGGAVQRHEAVIPGLE